MIAALFVEKNGVYSGIPGVDIWDKERDARGYCGRWPVVAHPPCERWGRYWNGGPSAKVKREKGDDGGCFASALGSVRMHCGVLEHPEGSAAWPQYGLTPPPKGGGWVMADFQGGWTCCVDQGFYGHPAAKATWLYVFGAPRPALKWGRCGKRLNLEGLSYEARRRAIKTGICQRLSKRQRASTPIPFRDLLLSIANGVTT